uniref:Uncharacterized protein n=1 Tax=viral metagenome TaxID=1070528 RepID=A0A6C0C7C5_9ZZZZ
MELPGKININFLFNTKIDIFVANKSSWMMTFNKMLSAPSDIIKIISNHLTNKEKIRLTMISKLMDLFKFEFMYHEKVDIIKI